MLSDSTHSNPLFAIWKKGTRFLQKDFQTNLGGFFTLSLAVAVLCLVILLPLSFLFIKSFQDQDGLFIGWFNFAEYFSLLDEQGNFIGLLEGLRSFPDSAVAVSLGNSLQISLISAVLVTSLALLYAYGLSRTNIPFKGAWKVVAQIPILAPSLLPAISLFYLFGNQGILKGLLMGESIYGPIGIVLGEVIWTFPHALMILLTGLSLSDARLYEAAESMKVSKMKIFFTVTLPGMKYPLISTFFVVFTLVITDFGIPKVIGGDYSVLATDIYKQVVGQQNFQVGSVIGLILLFPALLSFYVDRRIQRKQVALVTAKSVVYKSKKNPKLDAIFLVINGLIASAILSILFMAAFASLIEFWPYNLSLTLSNYDFDQMDGGSWEAFRNSLEMAGWTALFGTPLIFSFAYLSQKMVGFRRTKNLIHLLSMIPLAVPGMVLGLAYVFFFNHPDNPLNFLYDGMTILVLCTIVHFYTVSHLTAVTALKQIDSEFEAVSASLKVTQLVTFFRVTVPICLPVILDISVYLFMNAMTTVSAVIFLYSSDTTLASIAVLNMDDAGDTAPAAAMAMMILMTSACVRLLHLVITRKMIARTQSWRK
ncbi:MAG: putative 2-aminoethylphosphonate ABC transporter permease subunit [SAR324 cluster bacterium]|uniref:Putative 2-aminoethylphosphonate ABC transporter permease subunit n=1 Tax=SAR324 cluster bacterium TaxID=2024889 RepID=A0A2A4STP4_9DELT|nr:MAG: putative 2-aminoethylphosphonate ABC transporter permease subunit [SAR324 cluster bacterium]